MNHSNSSLFDNRLVILARHAQTTDKQAGQHDKMRILTSTGTLHARSLGTWLMNHSYFPDILLTSSAVRAFQTSSLIAEQNRSLNLLTSDNLYNAPAEILEQELLHLSSQQGTILLVAHNPGISDLASSWAGKTIIMSPGSCAVFRFVSSAKQPILIDQFEPTNQ